MFITLPITFPHTEPWCTNYLLSAAPFQKCARNMRCCLRTLCTQRENDSLKRLPHLCSISPCMCSSEDCRPPMAASPLLSKGIWYHGHFKIYEWKSRVVCIVCSWQLDEAMVGMQTNYHRQLSLHLFRYLWNISKILLLLIKSCTSCQRASDVVFRVCEYPPQILVQSDEWRTGQNEWSKQWRFFCHTW